MSQLRRISPRAWHVWRRDLDVFFTTWKTNFLPPILEPVYYVLAFGFGMGGMVGDLTYQGQTVSYLKFMGPGVIALAILFWAYFETTYSSFVRMYYQKTFDAIIATPLLVEDVIAGEWYWGATKSLMAGAIVLVMLSLFGLVTYPSGLLVLPLSVLGGLLFSAQGLMTTAVVPKIDSFNVTTFLFVFPMFLFSGTFFPIEVLPRWAFWIAEVLPLTHISNLARGACLGIMPSHVAVSVIYLLVLTAVSSYLAFRWMTKRLVK